MAFGTLKGTLVGGNNSIPNPLPAAGSVVVAAGDLVVAVCTQQTALTVTACADNLGNTYTAQNAGTLSTVSGRMYYARVTVPGTLTTINFTTTSSTNDASCAAAVYSGPFIVSPLDANPANLSADLTTPYSCPATGTLAQALELIIGWAATASGTLTAGGGLTRDVEQLQSANAATHISSLVVNATTTQTPTWTGTAPTADVLGTASFKADLAVPALNKIFDDLSTRAALPTDFPLSLRTWMRAPPPANVYYIPSRVGQWGVPADLMPPARVRGYGRAPQQAVSVVVPSPVPNVDWQLPIAPFRVMQTWIQSPLMPQVDVTKMPGRVVEWGMWLDPRVAMTWTASPMFAPPVVPKPVVVDWQLPRQPLRTIQLHTWLRAPFTGTPLPRNQYNWPLPILPVRAALTWTQSPIFASPVVITFMPGRVVDWGVVDTSTRGALTWIQSPPPAPVSTAKPVNQSDWPLPVRAVRATLTWTQAPMFATPVVVTPPTFMPGRVVDWGMAWETPRRALTFVRGVAGVDMAKPVNQADWPLPVRSVERARTWTQAPMFATPVVVVPPTYMPGRVTDWGMAWEVPRRALTFVRGVAGTDMGQPVNNVLLVGALAIRSTIFVPADIQNVLALRATPPPPKPINQYDWPVPRPAPRLSGGYSFAFSRNTKDMSPVNMPPRIGVFSPPIGPYYPNDLRTFTRFPFQGVGPSAASSGMVHNIPFIATMGGMTAR